jgi:hypothetical protein
MSNELPLVHQALAQRGVKVRTLCTLTAFDGETAALADLFTGAIDGSPAGLWSWSACAAGRPALS